MRVVVAICCLAAWFLYIGQFVSVIDFKLAQRLGLQENPATTDPIVQPLEMWVARWDLCWLWTLPAAGILMLIDHAWWPFAAMLGGGAFVDTGGREAAKGFGLRQHGVSTGSPRENRLATFVFVYFIAVGILAIVTGLLEVT